MSIRDKIGRIWKCIFLPTCIAPIRFTILLENLVSIYRNICYYKKKYRAMIYFRIMIEILITIGCIAIYFIQILQFSAFASVVYFYMNSISSITIMLLGCYWSKTFKAMLLFIEGNDLYFANDEKYQSNIKRCECGIKIGMYIYNAILVSSLIVKFVVEEINGVRQNGLYILYILNARICDCRCTYQYVTLYSVLYVISEQVDCITRAVTNARKAVSTAAGQRYNVDDDSSEISIDVEKFDELSTVFTKIKESSKLFNKIYGFQLVLMLGLATAYCIMFMYTMAFLSVKGFKNVGSLISSITKLLMYFLLLLLLSMGAQKKQNSVNSLRRQLGKLLINHIHNDAHYKATKNFLRLVSTRSIVTETLGSIQVDMTLIPSFIMFITSYTVIALQFNNIV